jgi:hypothetical protein
MNAKHIIALGASVLSFSGAIFAQTGPISLPDAAPAAINEPTNASATPQNPSIPVSSFSNAPVAANAIPDASLRLADALGLEKQDKLLEARSLGLELLCPTNAALKTQIEELLGRVNIRLVATPRGMPEKIEYTVKSGDSLGRIAKMFGTTEDLAQAGNLIKDPALIRVGDHFRIFSGKFSVVVNKTRNDLVLSMNDRFFKRYPIGTGKFGKTPVGTFVVQERIKEPVWYRPDGKAVLFGDKENILGTRWLALKATGNTPDVKGYGLHGTWDETSIGKQESSGCVRMRNMDIEEFYLLLPVGTPVVIEE